MKKDMFIIVISVGDRSYPDECRYVGPFITKRSADQWLRNNAADIGDCGGVSMILELEDAFRASASIAEEADEMRRI